MADIDGGALSFKTILDSGQMDGAIEETLRRVQGLSDGTVAGGEQMQEAMNDVGQRIEQIFADIDQATGLHKQALKELESEYSRLGAEMGQAFMAGKDDEYRKIKDRQTAIGGEIATRKKLVAELAEQADALQKVEQQYTVDQEKAEKAASAHGSFRTQLRLAREELMQMAAAGLRGTEAYDLMQKKVGELQHAVDHARMQAKAFANDEAQFQGIISGLSGVAGGFSAVTGAMSLFADKNEDLQRIMTKVQSVMAITIGLQQVAQVLDKDSAFRLVTLGNLQNWWAGVKAKAIVVQTAENVATVTNTAVKEANTNATRAAALSQTGLTGATLTQTAAAGAGTVANVGLAGAFRLVGAAIKSIPVFGWILAGISGLITLYGIFSTKAKAAKKEQEEFSKVLIDGAYKPIGAIEELSAKYSKLGDNLAEKKKFVEENQKAFSDLGVSVSDVADAENLLIRNKDAFINAQIAKARAAVIAQQANEKIKESLALQQKIEAMPDTAVQSIQTGGGGMAPATFIQKTVANPEKYKTIMEKAALDKEITKMFNQSADALTAGMDGLNKAGINTAEKFKEGTVGALEEAIQRQNDALKKLSDPKAVAANQAETKKLQKQLDDLLGTKTKEKKAAKTEDPVIKQIEERKKSYQDYNKWVNAGLQKEADIEFAALLQSGKTYKAYLDNLIKNGKLSKEQALRAQNELVEISNVNLLSDFKESLNEQMNNADSVIAKLNVIKSMRGGLTGDGTDLDKGKKEALDEGQKKALEQAANDLKKAQTDYQDYINSKISADERYFTERDRLQKQYNETNDPTLKKAITAQIQTLDTGRDLSQKMDYDKLLEQYQSYQQKRAAISKDFDDKIAIATKNGNKQLEDELLKAKKEALNKADVEEIQKSPDYTTLFSNLDNLSVKKMMEIRDRLEAEWTKLDLPPDQLKALRDQLDKVTDTVRQKNPFAALADAFKKYKEAANDEARKATFKDQMQATSASLDMVSQAMGEVISGIEEMGVTMDEGTKQILADIQGIVKGASQIAQGIATGNPLSIIQGSISVIKGGLDLIFGGHDRKAQKAIQAHAEAVKKLQDAYDQLKRSIDKALGNTVYDNQKAAIDNLRQQQIQIKAMQEAEASKKKADKDKIAEYKKQYQELGNQIEDIIASIADDVLQTSSKSLSDTLGDALVDAFSKGEDAAKSFEQVANNVLKNAIINQLKKNFLEKQVQDALDKLYKDMGGSTGTFNWDGLTDAERAAFKGEIANIGSQFNEQLKAYSDLFKDMTPEVNTSLTGAVKGVTEETASLLAGQINAIRINQAESGDLLRQSLMNLARIAENTSYNKFLQSIDSRLEKMATTTDPLRGQGVIIK